MPESTTRGALTEAVYYILLSVYRPMHGYAIMQNITELSGGRVTLGAGTLYGAINTLLDKGWITSAGNGMSSRKKEYVISDLGKTVVEEEITRLDELLRNGKAIMEGNQNE
jgi:DNA-binding PadR family transcriptional regulator